MLLRSILLILCFFTEIGAKETIAIFTHKIDCLGTWDPDSIQTGLPGSEEAVVYMAKELADLGYDVMVLGNPPESSKHTAVGTNPRYLDCDLDKGEHVDIAIAWRRPEIGRQLKKRASFVYLWVHDIARTPFIQEDLSFYDDVLWLSQWQREQWTSVSPGFSKFTTIYGNGIVPEQFGPVGERENPYSCIYGSNCSRGVEVLLTIWPQIKQQFPRATLEFYYGWPKWGKLPPEKEQYLRKLIEELKSLGVLQHGFVGHEELNRAYEQASFWTYPCLAPETFQSSQPQFLVLHKTK